MKRLFLLTILFFVTDLATGQLYHPGEVLDYRVSYKAKLFPNTEVGSVRVATTLDTHNGRPVYKIDAHGRTLPTYRWFFDIDDRYVISADTATRQPIYFHSDIKEAGYTFWSSYDYDWKNHQIVTRWQSRTEPIKSHTMALTDQSMDAISLFFRMRSADPNSFRPGEVHTLQMVLEDTVRHIKYRFEGREQKKIRNMGRYHTLRFACQLGSSESFTFTDGTEFTIWISDDENKIPLYLESPVRIGSVQAYISSYKGLKYPVTSLIK